MMKTITSNIVVGGVLVRTATDTYDTGTKKIVSIDDGYFMNPWYPSKAFRDYLGHVKARKVSASM